MAATGRVSAGGTDTAPDGAAVAAADDAVAVPDDAGTTPDDAIDSASSDVPAPVPEDATAVVNERAAASGVAADAIVLAGGRASRLGGVDKTRLEVGGRSLLDGAVDALLRGVTGRVIVVERSQAPSDDPECRDEQPSPPAAAPPPAPPSSEHRRDAAAARRVVRTSETPAFGGPVAGIAAALPLVAARDVVVLAGDLAAPDVVLRLLEPFVGADAGAQLRDPDGRPQPLAAVYRATALRAGLARLPDGGRDASMRQLLAGQTVTLVDAAADAVRDVDTWEDLVEARRRAPGEGKDDDG